MEQIQITNDCSTQTNNLNYLIDPTFTNVNRFFALSFPRNNNTDSRYSYLNYYVPKVKINDFNLLIDGKSFFDLSYFKENQKLTATHLSKKVKLKDPQQINFIGKLLKNAGAAMFFIIEKSEETTFNFSKNSITII